MTIFGKPLSEYVGFCKPFLILIPLVGILKLVLSLTGTSNSTTWWLSTNALLWLGIIYYAIHIHSAVFGSYRHLLVICTLLNLSAQVISILGITLALFAGADNVYAYAFGEQETTWTHLFAHLFFGIPFGSLLGWLGGCLILAITRKISGVPGRTSRSAV